ncbi:similar to Saccharomyces cerevisiae YDR501W PLM2 Forkhead Associated domain containing protein and putative transcription factor found associated with chromatin [Maudiozyma saulgeensis]|uniref:Similar to Saccharomyces cerevisiae YDR501W PLM2 Forkhead Associated domain containing protein and putative transcription factor found associated with chromatin n=1 Tax=Maudiozyma saulgeensis TaxID=1789683 RepID=A0A1X7R383_9SACH|nr:similar to Saccharomyces cerevisiae YDR501W PLM2 Forkhead Associated domain containing protein and putative transcription factor found associated with chromatin [Kazachstania saulgeensis]
MNNMFPPSSPLASSNALNFEENNKNSPNSSFYGSKPSPLVFKHDVAKSRNTQYPSPFPSSSIGRSSSPVKTSVANLESSGDESPDSSFVGIQDLATSPHEKINAISPPKSMIHKSKSKDHAKYKVFPRIIDIEIDPISNTQLTIGRKKDMCDILLPGMRTISRTHAVINYLPDRNQIKLKCIGINGIIVSLPRRLNCLLIRPTDDKNIYELCAIETIKMRQQFQQVDTNVDKDLIKSQNLTAFTLEPGETILMPFMNSTMIDFKQVKTSLSMKHPQNAYSTNSEENIAQRSISSVLHNNVKVLATSFQAKKLKGKKSTPTTAANDTVTPMSSFIVREPKTPTKQRNSSLKASFIEPKDKKITSNLHHALADAHLLDLHNSTKDTTQSHKRKLGTSFVAGSSNNKRAKHSAPKSTEEILKDLQDKGTNVQDLKNVLANHLAFANVQQTPLSQLKDTNSTIKTLSKEELRMILTQTKCVGVITRTGKDAAGKPLEEEYFYDMENDDDEQRKALVTSMKGGRTGLRSCRRTHKQYFWKRPGK